MNQQLFEEFANSANLHVITLDISSVSYNVERDKKFAELIVNECLQVLRNEWYKENNKVMIKQDPRHVGIHVGHKGALITALYAIRSHFGINND